MLHSLKARLALLFSLMGVLFSVGLVSVEHSRRHQVHLLLDRTTSSSSARFDSLLAARSTLLARLARHCASCDDVIRLVRTADTTSAASRLAPVLRNHGLDVLFVCTREGELVWAQAEGFSPGPSAQELGLGEACRQGGVSPDGLTAFFAKGPHGVFQLSGAQIRDARSSAPLGFVFLGWKWDEARLRHLAAISGTTVALSDAPPGPATRDPWVVSFTVPLPGLGGQPVASLWVESTLPGIEAFWRASRQYLYLSILFAAGLIVGAVFAVTYWVSWPLRRISRSLTTDDPSFVEPLKRHQSEFGDIAHLIDRFFQQRQQLERENLERRRAEEGLRVSHRFLEIANRHRELEPLLREFSLEIERFTGCTMAGVTLSFTEDGSKVEFTVGFGDTPHAHVIPCTRTEVRGICRAIMAGRVTPGASCFTEAGSCVMNQASRQLRQALGELHWDICTRCWRLDFESVALVPIKAQDRILGLIQVADQRQHMFPPHVVDALEGVAKQLGIAVLRVKAEERLAFLATHDLLTGLPNRAMAGFRFQLAMSTAEERRERIALMLLDLDYFKSINDTLGHAAGDKLLQAASSRLTRILRRTDTAVRMGGDEFLVILPQVLTPEDVSKVAAKILECLREPFLIEGRELRISGTIGVAVYPDHGADIDTLLKHADIAMYRAKAQGRNTFCVFSAEGQP